MKAPYTDEQLINNAKLFTTREQWRAAGDILRSAGKYSPYGSALKRGRDFMRLCCAHMVHGKTGNLYGLRYSDDDLIQAAQLYQHRGDWKKADNLHYSAAWHRGILDKCCAHMTPAANPYAGDYEIYAYEFEDKHVYVGLSFVSRERDFQHRVRGPVFAHALLCPNYAHKIIEGGIPTPQAAGEAERKWMEHYRANGWTLLNRAKAGGTGAVLKQKWSKEAVCAEARKYATRQEWIDNSQFTYRLAKKLGWFDEASAHMPKRVLGIGLGLKRSEETRRKLAAIAQVRAADSVWRAAHSATLKGRRLTQAHREAIGLGMAARRAKGPVE